MIATMGMDINIYTKNLSADLVPMIQKKFADFHMDIEFHPDFKFDEQIDTGFLPIKLKVHPGHSKQYDNIDFEIMAGFEILYNDYDYEKELEAAQTQLAPENKTIFSKIFGNKKPATPETRFVANYELDQHLRYCTKDVMLNWKSWNKSELRISLFFAAILAEQTDGIIYDPQNGRYLSGQRALQIFPLEIEEYENSFSAEEFTVDKFEEWL